MEEIIYEFIFPGFGYGCIGYIFNENKWIGYKNDFMNFLLSLPKEYQLIGFFILSLKNGRIVYIL